MTLVAIILFISTLALVGSTVHPRTRKFFIIKEKPVALLPADSAKLAEWKQIFRTTVKEVDGELTADMDAFLRGEEMIATGIVEEAKKTADKIIEDAKAERETLLAEREEAPNDRPLLAGGALQEYRDDRAAAKTGQEHFGVISRWHKKGYRFSRQLRAEMLKNTGENTMGIATRDSLRLWFDEQDKPTKKKKEEIT